MSGEIITLEEFKASIAHATNLSDDQKEDAALEQSMDEANALLDEVAEASGYNLTTMYFLFMSMGEILLDTGWTPEELSKDLLGEEL